MKFNEDYAIALLKNKSGITREEYMKMDSTDMENAFKVAGVTKEEHEQLFEKLPDRQYLEMMKEARKKHGI